ncbi:MoxR family ATPase [Spirillospora sp. NPDC029432]|uniref:AAA family ATPase n=1 Tax=Spirillospora sp. NPDC029432 TaxID=3154599 RepID=UPI0034515297
MSADERPDIPAPGDGRRFDGSAAEASADGKAPAWWIYRGTGRPLHDIDLRALLPPAPPWRRFGGSETQPPPAEDDEDLARRLGPVDNVRGVPADPREIDAVNAALYLRRPLLVTGKPGVGKSTLAYRISRELRLGRVLRWPISSRSTLRSGLYEYDAIGRAQEAAASRSAGDSPGRPDEGSGIGSYLRLGPLGTALLPYELPRVLLIDELDKSDIDLPNDLLDVFEEGEFTIPELVRISSREPTVKVHTADPEVRASVRNGHIRCQAFPVIIITSNAEREFPPAFLRRCLQFHLREPDEERLASMIAAHFADRADEHSLEMVYEFLTHRRLHGGLAADQLLNAVYLATSGAHTAGASWQRILDLLWQRLDQGQHEGRPEAVAE